MVIVVSELVTDACKLVGKNQHDRARGEVHATSASVFAKTFHGWVKLWK